MAVAALAEDSVPAPTAEPTILDVPIPDHVPSHLVRDLRVAMGMVPNELDDPYEPTLRLMQDDVPPVMWSPFAFTHVTTGLWVVKSYADISKVYTDGDLFSTDGVAAFQLLVGETWPSLPLGVDAPDHAMYRRFLNPWFTAKAVAEMAPSLSAMIDEMIDSVMPRNGCDFAWDFARVFPVRVFLRLMGMPFSMFEDFLRWEYEILHSRDFTRMAAACSATLAYLRGFIADKEALQDDTLTSRIVNGQIEGRPLTRDERIGIIFFLWLGGLDTVASTLSQMFRRLAMDASLQTRLRNDHALIPSAVEEFLRVQPLVNSVRKLKRDIVMHGVAMREGDHIMCLNSVGNFDPQAFKCPRDFDPARRVNRHHTLASGPHICLGAHLARQELQLALRHWLSRVPSFRLREGADRAVVPGLMSARNLEICW